MAVLTIKVPRQLVATGGNGFSLIPPFPGLPICHRLPLVAPARLHKRSIPVAGIPDEKSDSAPSRSRDTGLTPSV